MRVLQAKIRRVALIPFLLLASTSWAGPVVALKMGAGGFFRVGTKSDPNSMHGSATDAYSITSGMNSAHIFNGDLFFNTHDSIPGHQTFYSPGEQLLVTGWLDLNHDGVARNRGDLWGVLIAAKLLNPHLIDRDGQIFFVSQVLETINPKLAALLGLTKTTYRGMLELQLLHTKSGNPNHYLIEEGLLTTASIPEPASILLLGLPLLWFGGMWWAHRASW